MFRIVIVILISHRNKSVYIIYNVLMYTMSPDLPWAANIVETMFSYENISKPIIIIAFQNIPWKISLSVKETHRLTEREKRVYIHYKERIHTGTRKSKFVTLLCLFFLLSDLITRAVYGILSRTHKVLIPIPQTFTPADVEMLFITMLLLLQFCSLAYSHLELIRKLCTLYTVGRAHWTRNRPDTRHKHKMQPNFHVLIGIRTHDPSA
jgi:hypothetical protein